MKNISRDYILPTPKRMTRKKGVFSINRSWRIYAQPSTENESRLLASGLNACLKLKLAVIDKVCPSSGKKVIGLEIKPSGGAESYRLSISSDRIVITGPDTAGVFYGVQTLLQLVRAGQFSCCEIVDAPACDVRGIHIDIKYQMLRFDYLKRLIPRFAEYKINTILFEYEDKFAYDNHPDVNHRLALTKPQVKTLSRIAEKNHIEIIPLLQSLGHSEYILRHPRYRSARELPEVYQQRCPLNPEGLELFKQMALETMQAHRYSRYLHIGGDETYQLGRCPRCRAYVKKRGKSRLCIDYINRVIAWVCEQGRVPIMYHDMLIDHPEAIDRLDRRVIISYWEYRDQQLGGDEVPFVVWGLPNRYKQSEDVLKIPAHIRKLYRQYWDAGSYPLKFRAFPYIEFFKDRGFKVIGLPCTRFFNSVYPEYEELFPNIRKFSRRIRQAGELGTINTSWDSHGLPFELTWYGVAAGAEYGWSSRNITRKRFDDKFVRQFFGADDPALLESLYVVEGLVNRTNHSIDPDRNQQTCNKLLNRLDNCAARIKYNRLFVDYLRLALKIAGFIARKDGMITYVTDMGVDKWYTEGETEAAIRANVDGLKLEFERLVREYRRVLKKTVCESEIGVGRSFRLLMLENDIKHLFRLAETLPGQERMSCF